MAAAGVAAVGVASAQTKVAVINMQQAVLATGDIKKQSAELEAKYKPRSLAIEQLRADLDGIQQKLQAGQGKLSPAAEQDLTVEGQRKQRALQRMSQDLQDEVDGARNEILGAAGRRMIEVIRKLADEKGVDVVVEGNSTLFFKAALDITADATAAYDKAYPAK
ncbi:MAG TPA: OmpH family outer membrane protein [Bryobacteraceae bacterium]|nr:OmpH family outer membrane protein [Bryobacteraceae bacterium]